MKTTVQISDALLAEGQTIAAREKTTLRTLINEGLERVVKERDATKPFRLRDGPVAGAWLIPTLDGASWETIRELAHDGRG